MYSNNFFQIVCIFYRFLLVDFGLAQRVNEHEDSQKLKVPISKTTVVKRKREDDVSIFNLIET